jgi:hypothetical protein
MDVSLQRVAARLCLCVPGLVQVSVLYLIAVVSVCEVFVSASNHSREEADLLLS